jgi:phosphonate transport system permease protein
MATEQVAIRRPPRNKASLRRRIVWLGFVLGTAAIYVHAWRDIGASFSAVVTGIGNLGDLIRRSTPPNTDVLHASISAAIVTLDTALIGTTIALVLSLLITPLAAKNLAPNRALYELARIVIAFTRTIPSFIFALYMVVVVGLGPYSAALAIAIHSIGTLGKLFGETIEDMDTGPVDALRAAGAGRTHVFLHAVLPGVAPTFVSLSLYRFDVNVRDSLATGFVGGGGIGFLLFNSIQLFQYRDAAMELLVLLVVLLAVERVSTLLRSRMV